MEKSVIICFEEPGDELNQVCGEDVEKEAMKLSDTIGTRETDGQCQSRNQKYKFLE